MPTIMCLALVAPTAALAQPTAGPAQGDPTGGNEYSEDVPNQIDTPDPEPGENESQSDTDTGTGGPAPAPTGTAPAAAPAAPAAASPEVDTATLPRTGSDSWVIALIGGALLATGVSIRRRTALRARP